MKDACTAAGLEGKTNHSLRATGATRMYHKGVTEKAIQGRTGHKRLEALCTYEVFQPIKSRVCVMFWDLTNERLSTERSLVPMQRSRNFNSLQCDL